jgi:hypothetical protein
MGPLVIPSLSVYYRRSVFFPMAVGSLVGHKPLFYMTNFRVQTFLHILHPVTVVVGIWTIPGGLLIGVHCCSSSRAKITRRLGEWLSDTETTRLCAYGKEKQKWWWAAPITGDCEASDVWYQRAFATVLISLNFMEKRVYPIGAC